jgi:short-subunit dehydrogenase
MKNIIITGAANGIGKAVANILKENNLILIDEDNNSLEQVAKDLNAKFYICNLANENDIKILLNDIKNNYENIDCLINCAGMWISGDMSKLEQPIFDEMNSLERIKKVIDTNYLVLLQ